jgi:hypothetical protein
MVLILVDAQTERLSYTLDFIFKERGLQWQATTSQLEFETADVSYRLNYSERNSEFSKRITPCTLLRETVILDQKLDQAVFEGEPCLTFDGICDPISSIFYVLSRYEEYREQEKDEHGRFPASRSILVKYDWQHKVVCDRWAKVVIEFVFKELYLECELRMRLMNPVKCIPTFDIDNAYAYKNKNATRQILSLGRDLLSADFAKAKERFGVWRGASDPYDTYETIEDCLKRFKHARIFWLVASDGGKDRNIPLSNTKVKDKLNELAKMTKVGVHPGYSSFGSVEKLQAEKKELELAISAEVVDSRFHFLRFTLPESYRQLITAGITCDYSMGFAETAGFRIGTARAISWFDLEKNERTPLSIQPFTYMDGTLNEYLKITADESLVLIRKLYSEIRAFGGNFCFIWHNETISDQGKWKGWKSVFNETLTMCNE